MQIPALIQLIAQPTESYAVKGEKGKRKEVT
jgi:hypothetical protein